MTIGSSNLGVCYGVKRLLGLLFVDDVNSGMHGVMGL